MYILMYLPDVVVGTLPDIAKWIGCRSPETGSQRFGNIPVHCIIRKVFDIEVLEVVEGIVRIDIIDNTARLLSE